MAEPRAGPTRAVPPEDAVFRPVRASNAFEETVERILDALKLGLVAYGERLPAERDLADRLRVSRVTLRQAIKALQEAGYVDCRRGRYGGTFVRYRPGQEPLADLRVLARGRRRELPDALTFRHILEIGAAETAAGRPLSQDQAEYLRQRLAALDAADDAHYRQLDARLHLAIAELTGSQSLTSALADNRMALDDLLNSIPLLETNIAHSNAQHARIVRAVLAGRPKAAREAMAEHVEGTEALLRGFLGEPDLEQMRKRT